MELTYSPLQSGVEHLDVLLMSSISFVICVDTQTKRRRSTSLVVLVAVDVPAFPKSLQYFSELLAPHLYRHCHLVRNTGSSLFLLGPSLLLVVYRSTSFQVKYMLAICSLRTPSLLSPILRGEESPVSSQPPDLFFSMAFLDFSACNRFKSALLRRFHFASDAMTQMNTQLTINNALAGSQSMESCPHWLASITTGIQRPFRARSEAFKKLQLL